MGSNLTVINDTENRQSVEIWIFLSGSRTFSWNNGPPEWIPLKFKELPYGYQVKFGLGKVWYDIDISSVGSINPGTIYGQGDVYMGSNKTIRLSSWLPPPYGSRKVGLALSDEPSAPAESDKVILPAAGDSHQVIREDNPREPRRDDAAVLTVGDLNRLLDGAANIDGRAEQIQKAIQVFAAGIDVQIEQLVREA